MQDSGNISVPGKFTSKELTFEAKANEQRWASVEFTAEMPRSAAKAAFVRASATCRADDGRTVLFKQATENVLQDDKADFDLDGSLNTGDSSGTVTCELTLEAPSADAAASGVDLSASTYLGVSDPMTQAKSVNSAKPLPQTVTSGSSPTVYQDADAVPRGTSTMEISLVLQLTSCTISNGSNDPKASGPLCRGGLLDKDGSSVNAVINSQAIDAQGRVCSDMKSIFAQHAISYDQHHYVMTLGSSDISIPSCAESIRYSARLVNHGPAGTVIHSQGTDMSVAFRKV